MWVGPFTIIDGSGEIKMGSFCTISAGVHIYSHDNIKQTLTSGRMEIERAPVIIGDNVYIGPNPLVRKGVTIRNFCVIGASTLVNKSIPDYSIVLGQPGKVVGKVEFQNDKPVFVYDR